MDAAKTQYVIELLQQGDTRKAQQELKDLNEESKKTSEGMKDLAENAKTALEVLAISEVLHSSIEAFVEYEKAAARLGGTLKAIGQDSPAFRTELEEQAKAFSNHSVETEKSIMGVQTLLLSFGATKAQMPGLTQAVLDLSAGLGIDARTAALELSKALDGIDGPLKRIGITFDANAGSAERMDSIVIQLKNRMGGLAEVMAQTNSGKITELEKSFEGLRETLGELALKELKPAIGYTIQLVDATRAFLVSGTAISQVTVTLLEVTAALATLTAGAKAFNLAWTFTAGGAIEKAGGLMAALNALPKFIPISIIIAAALATGDAVYEGAKAAVAEGKQTTSAKDLALQNDKRRKAIEAQIDAAQGSGQIGAKEADDRRTQLQVAFTPSTFTSSSLDPMSHSGGVTTTTRNVDAEAAALRNIFTRLNPGVVGSLSHPTAPESTGARSPQELEYERLGLEELQKLQDKMQVSTAQGFEKQREEAQKTFGDQDTEIDNIQRHRTLSDDQVTTTRLKNLAEWEAKDTAIDEAEAKRKQDNLAKLTELQDALNEEGLTGVEKAIAAENRKYDVIKAHINSLQDITSPQRSNLLGMAADAHGNAMDQLVQPGQLEAERLAAQNQGGDWAVRNIGVNKQYDQQKADLAAYYDWRIQQAQQTDDDEVKLEAEKNAALTQLEQQRKQATSQTYQDLLRIGNAAEVNFAGGMTNAFEEIIHGTKSAGDAFKDFAASFLEQIAQMILQTIILRAVQSALGGIGGLAGGGFSFAGGGGATGDAAGGIHWKAANGIMLAADGMAGVNAVNGPTYFPDYKVLAGEAGREMMTVFFRPQSGVLNGEKMVTGNVGAERLAMMSMDSLSRMVGPRKMAGGGFSGIDGSFGTASGSGSSPNGGGGANDPSHIHVSLEPGLKAEIVNQAVAGARIQVAQDLNTDTPIRSAAKGAAGL